MISHLRERFNNVFSEKSYQQLAALLESEVGAHIPFRPCETPVFLPKPLIDELVGSSMAIISQLDTPGYFDLSSRAVPDAFRAPNEGKHPHFVQVDFALVEDHLGRVVPRLIELQGCASIYAFQYCLAHCYRRCYDLEGLAHLIGGLDDERYINLFRQTVLNGHHPDEVVLMEIDPLSQKTLPDFHLTAKLIGVRPVCITDIIRRGSHLFYRCNGSEIRIKRLYNRVIIDELIQRSIPTPFDFRDQLDVEWAGHPNWYFRWSKFSLPYLTHPTVPRAFFLDQVETLPSNTEDYVLKPLYSFAGAGVRVGPTREELRSIPADRRGDFLLQERVTYAPLVKTPDQPSRVEIRVMILWPDKSPPIPVTTLARLSKGLMMGVNFNQSQTWVGSSIAFYPDAGTAQD